MSADHVLLPEALRARLHILDHLSNGTGGRVLLCLDRELDRKVILKLSPNDSTPEDVTRFIREGRLLSELQDPQVVRVLDVGQHTDGWYILQESLNGPNLDEYTRAQGRVPPLEALGITALLARALARVHAHGILHRDVKPHNVVVERNRGPVLIDFGLAIAGRRMGHVTESLALVGTPAYLAPELIAGNEHSEQSDVYALGLALHFMILARSTFSRATLSETLEAQVYEDPEKLPDVPPAIQDLVDSACHKVPASRIINALAFAEQTERTIASLRAARGQRSRTTQDQVDHRLTVPAPPETERTTRLPRTRGDRLDAQPPPRPVDRPPGQQLKSAVPWTVPKLAGAAAFAVAAVILIAAARTGPASHLSVQRPANAPPGPWVLAGTRLDLGDSLSVSWPPGLARPRAVQWVSGPEGMSVPSIQWDPGGSLVMKGPGAWLGDLRVRLEFGGPGAATFTETCLIEGILAQLREMPHAPSMVKARECFRRQQELPIELAAQIERDLPDAQTVSLRIGELFRTPSIPAGLCWNVHDLLTEILWPHEELESAGIAALRRSRDSWMTTRVVESGPNALPGESELVAQWAYGKDTLHMEGLDFEAILAYAGRRPEDASLPEARKTAVFFVPPGGELRRLTTIFECRGLGSGDYLQVTTQTGRVVRVAGRGRDVAMGVFLDPSEVLDPRKNTAVFPRRLFHATWPPGTFNAGKNSLTMSVGTRLEQSAKSTIPGLSRMWLTDRDALDSTRSRH